MPFHDYVKRNILKPLRMRHSTYPTSVPPAGTDGPDHPGVARSKPIEITNFFSPPVD